MWTLLGDSSFVKQGGHHIRHQERCAVNTSEKREGRKNARRAVLQVSVCNDVSYPQETTPPMAYAG